MTLKAPAIYQRQEAGESHLADRRQRVMKWMRLHHWVVALVGYTTLTVALTFPVIFHLGDAIMGPYLADDSLWYTWYPYAFRQALAAGQDPSTTHLLYALLPHIQLFAASDINGAVGALLLSFMAPLAVYNVLILLTFILSGFTTYLLVNEFVPNRWAAFIAGCSYTFSTYHFWRVLSGLSLSSMEWMPLAAWRVFAFYRRPTWANAVWMGISLALMPLSDLYLSAYFLPVFGLTFLVGLLTLGRRWLTRPRNVLRAVAALALTAAVSLPLLASSLHVDPDVQAAIAQKMSSTEHFSGNVVTYLFVQPANPIVGRFTARLYTHVPASALSPETAGYLGLVAMALALVGLLVVRSRPRPRAQYFWLVIAVAAFLISLGPRLQVAGKTLLPLPFYGLLYDWPILSSFRAPNRMAPMVLLAVCVLAGYGLDALFARAQAFIEARTPSDGTTSPWAWRTRRLTIPLLGVLLIAASLGENIQFSVPYPFTHVPVPVVYEQMAVDPVPGLVLTLPVYPHGSDLFYQTVYHRGLVTGYPIRTTYTMIRTFENIPGVSLFDWPDSSRIANDPDAVANGELHDIFPLQETVQQGLQRDHIRYVVLRADATGPSHHVFPPIEPWMKPWLQQQLGAPLYDNRAEGLTVWRIDPGTVDPNVVRFTMGVGWLPGLKIVNDGVVANDPGPGGGTVARGILQDAELHIWLPEAQTEHLMLTAMAYSQPRTMAVSVNGQLVSTQTLAQPGQWQTLDLGMVPLRAGDNVLHFAGTQACVVPGASFPATLDPKCLMFLVSELQMAPAQR